ncbi:MAG: nuclear transport factor 2 family protein [Syntrophaceae bacterium]|nr:nuclear transport factor 2 family protein [Deltaproteobacteria bacterium]
MDSQQALAFCTTWLGSWTGNRPEELSLFYSEDAFYRDPANPQGLRGRAEILAYLRTLLKHNPGWVWEAEEVFLIHGGFVLRWRAGIPVGREIVRENGLDIVLLRDGLITRNEVFFDRSTLLTRMKQLHAQGKP